MDARPPIGHWTDRGVSLQDPRATEEASGAERQAPIIGAVLLLGVPVTLAAAQSSVPSVAVSVSGSNVVLDPSGPIGAGPTRFTFEGRGEFNLATLRAGVSVDRLRQSLSCRFQPC